MNAPGSSAATVEDWQRWIPLIQKKSMQYLGIPDIFGLDHNHGVTYTLGGTLFPQPINIGATFNTELARRGAEITAYVPAFDKEIKLKVYHMKDQGSYAVWKATKANGQYDLKTFEVKARPVEKFEGLRPGMSLIIK